MTTLSQSTRPAPETAPKPANSVLDMIGCTPMLKLRNMDTGPCRLFVKLENQNPGGSIKDRIGLSMIEAAERDGALAPGGTLVEATAGNTGLGLALVAAQTGYRLIIVMPDKMSQEKIFHLRALGAEVLLTRSDVGKGHPEYYQDYAERLARETPGAFYVNQFANPANPRAHETATAPRYGRAQTTPKGGVTFACDSGNKYLSKMYNDYWMMDQGFVERDRRGDLSDLISRRHIEHATYTIGPDEPLSTALSRMKLYDVSQLPVIEDERIVGIIDESDILLAVYDREDRFREPVRGAMTAKLETVTPTTPVEALLPVFARDHVAIVADEAGRFLGLITRIDLLNYLRRRQR